ncbi:MAG TPA: type IV pilus twitching motility protein PilT [Thermoleophilaceae bacterium]|nr:type IV pilus twitching motility protein PilT [Thermoleophilaceae bacterium]
MKKLDFNLTATLDRVAEWQGSDLHLKHSSPPLIRVNGELEPLDDVRVLEPADTEQALWEMLDHPARVAEFENEHEVDFSYSHKGANPARFRVNAFRQLGGITLVCRAIPERIRSIEELGLPAAISELAREERGIVLITGSTGSGKTTTLAAMVDQINSERARHIVTIEDPIEFVHRDRRSVINQREVGSHTESFARALRRVLRQDPDVILIGEMRDEETVRTALSAAETGHLVFSTLHTLDATESVNRIVDLFPTRAQQQARLMLASTLRGIVSQRLVRTADGGGRVASCEVLRMTGRVRDMIMRPDETTRLSEAIAEGAYYGMQTFDQALHQHVDAGRISMEDALLAASNPHDFKLLVAANGQPSNSVEQVISAQ